MLEDFWANALFSVTPTILIGLVFWLILRAILRADRTERTVYSRIEAEERSKRAGAMAIASQSRDASADEAALCRS